MPENSINPQCTECRLVLIETQSMRIVTTATSAGPLLPRVSIPASARVAVALTEAVEQRYGLCSIQLALLPGAKEVGACAVLEIIGPPKAVSTPHSLAALDEISSGEITLEERTSVLKIMRGEASELGRFARIGWVDELLARILSHQDRSSWPVVRQLNQGIDFCLLSLADTTGRKMWFKAVGEPNTREYALTLELTRRFPAFLPRILIPLPEWNGWVAEDVQGVPLNESNSIDECESALTALAVMQEAMAGDIASLSAIGAKDWTCARIKSLSEPFFEEACCAMQTQTSRKSRPLGSSELNQLKEDIESALREFMDAGLPETLLHGDIGHGNVLATATGPVFLDWAETYIGHPFLSAEHLLADLARSNPLFAEKQSDLRSFYTDHWDAYVQPGELKKVILLAPAMATFAYAVIVWDANRGRPDPTLAWPFLRSMLRRTRRELEQASEAIA